MQNNTLKALIFDIDGTLADTERDGHRVAFNQAFDEAGLNWHWDVELYGRLLAVTGGRERMMHYHQQYNHGPLPATDGAAFFVGLHQAKNRHYAALMAGGQIALRPGIRRLLHQARHEGLRLVIATTTTRSNVTVLLEHTLGAESIDWFEVIATADEVPDKKPSPAVYHYVLQQLGLTAHHCLALEDSSNGLVAARAAGLRTLVTINDYTAGSDFSGAWLIVDQLGEPGSPGTVRGGEVSGVAGHHVVVDVPLLRRLLVLEQSR
ncbi:MAG: HAD family hydrolase [Gammaproteobacteria bacterium]|nr:HAD family hydrolase [Gammaproteobacteria bacterium]